jgi:hypothetical protein
LENRLGFFKDPSCFFLSVFTFDFIVIFYFWEPPNTLDGSQAIEIGPHFFFGSKCNLNSGPHACEAHGLLLEPCTQPFLLWLYWRQGFAFCLGWPGLWLSYFMLPASWHNRCTQEYPAIGWEGVFGTFCQDWLWNHKPPYLNLSSS